MEDAPVLCIREIHDLQCYDEHTSPLFKNLGLLKLFDIIRMSNLLFMHDFYKKKLPTVFNDFFLPICDSHKFGTRLAIKISYCMPIVRTNYGKFSIRSKGPHTWNEIVIASKH